MDANSPMEGKLLFFLLEVAEVQNETHLPLSLWQLVGRVEDNVSPLVFFSKDPITFGHLPH